MKTIFYGLLLMPLMLISQNSAEYMIVENALIVPNVTKAAELDAGLAAHNKKFHKEGAYAAHIFYISNGPNTGGYIWSMGPLPWSAMDDRPELEGHDEDWNKNVLPYMMPQGEQHYWKFNPELSNFPVDFKMNKLLVDYYDVKAFQMDKAMALIKKIQKVMLDKFPNETYGIYTNELPSTKEGKDLAFVSFFQKSGWMGDDWKFADKYNEVHGAGSFATFLKDWEAVTEGKQSELWTFKPALSGNSGEVKAQE